MLLIKSFVVSNLETIIESVGKESAAFYNKG